MVNGTMFDTEMFWDIKGIRLETVRHRPSKDYAYNEL